MSDRAALLAAIVANPDEDTPRLVYADWLEENGQAKRAAVIRKQIEYHRLMTSDTATNAAEQFLSHQYIDAVTRVKWAKVDAELGALMAARKKGTPPFGFAPKAEGLPAVKGAHFSNCARGFFDTADVGDAGAFLKHADAIFRAAPITNVNFHDLTAEDAKAFAASGHLARVRELFLGAGVQSYTIHVLGSHRDAAAVRKLEVMPDNNWANDAIEALTSGKYWTGLESLEVSDLCDGDEPPGDGQMAELFARPQLRNLRSLVSWGSAADDAAVRAIVKNMPELRNLDLTLNPIGDAGRVFAAIKKLRHLRNLDLSSCDLEGGDAAALIATADLPNLTVLDLGSNNLTGPDPKVLAKSDRGPGLRVLDIGSSELSPRGVEALVKCPAARGLWYLALSVAQLADDHIERFTRHAAFDRLAYLDLSINDIGARGAKALAAWPGAANLQSLNLWSNPIGATGAKALAASANLAGLKYLHAGKYEALKKRFRKVFSA